MRLVLDTNVLVSGLLFPGGPPSRLVAGWRAGAFDLVLSEFLIDELVRTSAHLAPRLNVAPHDLTDFIDTLRLRCDLVPLDPDLLQQAAAAGLRDPDDVPILALLMAGAADVLVTGDKDLLALADRFPILSPAAFEARFMP
ncbi:MAG: putative toxin-antitoxin system toxin component, PIN family [Rubrivivax sp.]|nr:putative toxin-antitoxin system toxin component, PIN family [Rubrivivax sp.]